LCRKSGAIYELLTESPQLLDSLSRLSAFDSPRHGEADATAAGMELAIATSREDSAAPTRIEGSVCRPLGRPGCAAKGKAASADEERAKAYRRHDLMSHNQDLVCRRCGMKTEAIQKGVWFCPE
jgi:hypothetical protein